MSNKVAIIGHFGGNKEFFDGQTIKTKILYEELKNAVDWRIDCIDTYNKTKKPIRLLLQTIAALICREKIIVLLSGNGMKFFFPLLYFFSKYWKVKVYHDVIGGNLDTYIEKIPQFKKFLSSFKINWVETQGLQKRLSKKGITNCAVLPNFKRLQVTVDCKYKATENGVFRFCTFSRVMKEKGINDAVQAIEMINEEFGSTKCSLDIFGAISEEYRDEFNQLMALSSDSIQYRGTVPYNKSVEALKDYYALLFPTYWDGEGFPGTIVDSYAAGVPVIATDWNCNSELVINGVTGILYELNDKDGLYKSIKKSISNTKVFCEYRKNCVEEALRYMPDNYIAEIINALSQD